MSTLTYLDAVKTLDEIDPLLEMSLIDLSNSRIETFQGSWGCEAKYFYNYIIKEQDPAGAAALLGNVVHQVFENVLDNDKKLDINELLSEYKTQLTAYDQDGIIDNNLAEAGLLMLEEYYERHQDDIFVSPDAKGRSILGKELGFEIVVGNAKMRGYIDRVDIEENILYITDFKSGKNEVAQKHTPTNLQLGIYALAMKKAYPHMKIYAELYYLRSGRRKGHLFSDGDLTAVVENILEISEKITGTRIFKTTSNKRICNYCPHAASGICKTGVYLKK